MHHEARALIQRLSPLAKETLKRASEQAAACGHYEVTVIHTLEALLDDPLGEVSQLLRRVGSHRDGLLTRVAQTRRTLRAGNIGRPKLSPLLVDWLRDTWMLASLERGETSMRSGALLLQLLRRSGAYAAEGFSELETIDPNRWAQELDGLVDEDAAPTDAGPAATPSASAHAGTPNALSQFASDLTAQAETGQIDPIVGRQVEIRQLIDVLVRRRKNNPLIVGEPGVGKTALVEGLALAIAAGEVPPILRDVRIFALDLGALHAGAQMKGEFERRFKQVIADVQSSERPIVLFIDEAHTLVPSGSSSDAGDAANLLKPALARGQLRTIAATTWAEFKRYFEKDAALERRFQPIQVAEPNDEEATAMLLGLRKRYEDAHGILIRDEALHAAVRLSRRYIPGRQLPDKAVDLLDTTAARIRVERSVPPPQLGQLRESISLLEERVASIEREKAVCPGERFDDEDAAATRLAELREEETRMAAQWANQKQALEQLLHEQRATPSEALPGGGGQALLDAWTQFRSATVREALCAPYMDAEAVARTVSSWTGIPLGKMRRDASSALLDIESAVATRVIGQSYAASELANALQASRADIRDPEKPVAVFLFVGPSGVGKTETALTVADTVYGGDRFLITINMSEFQERHSVSRLVGSPPGYVGYGEGGRLTEAVRRQPYSVVLLDEVEKAHPDVLNLFYQVFDKGVLADGEGREVCFRNTLIILTSNLASDAIETIADAPNPPTPRELIQQIRPTLIKHFKAALLARMTVVPFYPIEQASMEKIVSLKLSKLAARINRSHGLSTRFSPELVSNLSERSHATSDGARSVDHLLQSSLMPSIARRLLSEDAAEGTFRELIVGIGADAEIAVELSSH